MHISNATVLDEANAITARVDAGTGAGKLRVYSGTVPTDADTALGAQVLLADIPLNDPSFGAAADASPGGTITLDVSPAPTVVAVATGTASFARLVDSDNNVVVQFDTVTATGGGGEVEINAVNIQSGANVDVTGGTITVPES